MQDVDLTDWVGRSETVSDVATAGPQRGLAALMDDDFAAPLGAPVPILSHWLYFLRQVAQSGLDIDGHPQRGGFLPPVDLPRRMWVGGEIEIHDAIRVDDALTRRSTIASVTEKAGSGGRLVFVSVDHEIETERGLALRERQDIVYREAAGPSAPATLDAVATAEPGARTINSVQLFRFSALTFNSHRIHYDQPYATGVEGYPALVVHGPYLAMLMGRGLAEGASPGGVGNRFGFRLKSPVFEGVPFRLSTADGLAAIEGAGGRPCAEARLEAL